MKLDRNYTISELADFLTARIDGDPNHQVSGINEIHMVEPGDLTFVDHPKYYDKALNSKATTILINKEVECPEGKGLIISTDPFGDYVKLVRKFRSFQPSTAFISPSAEVGEGTMIQPGAFVGNHVKIGKNCIIHANVSIYDHVIIGDNVVIQTAFWVLMRIIFNVAPKATANSNRVEMLLLRIMLKLVHFVPLIAVFRATQ